MSLTNPKCLLLFIGLLFSTSLFAQKLTVYGSVKDALTGENLIGGYSGNADPPCPVMLTPHKDYGSKNLND